MLRECYRYEVERRGYIFQDDTATAEHLRKTARWLVEDTGHPGLLLLGDPGNGKTTLARSIKRLINTLYDSALSTERKEVRQITASSLVELSLAEKKDYLQELKFTDLLYIDDVGTELASVKVWGNEVSPLVELLYSRYDRQLFTLITTNLNSEADIISRYGSRIADRFSEMFDVIPFENPSYRQRLKPIK